MPNFPEFRASAILLFLSIATISLDAQPAAECSLRGADTTLVTGVTVKKCLDLDALNGKSVQIPSNVTRIDNSGFALCESSEQSGGQADIVYVMDQSGSMNIQYVWISADLRDTVYLNSLGGCTNLNNNDANGFGTVTLPNDAGVRQVTRLNPAKTTAGCNQFSGDPYNQRGIAFKSAIDYQAARAPGSTAGYMGFAQNVIGAVRPLVLNTAANVTRLKAAIAPRFDNNTNYWAPLDTSKKWLRTPSITPNPSKAVIFLSDGLPTYPSNNPDAYLDVLSPTYPSMPGTMPPVYGIFMGRPSADTIKLADLSKRTGGQFFLIPPSRPDSLKTVVERILNVILRQYQPSTAVVTNNSVVPPQTGRAGPGSFIRQDNGHWLMSLDKPVGLKAAGDNAVDVTTEMVDAQSGALKPKSITFTLNTTGPQETTNKNLIGTQFSVSCIDLPPPINKVKVAYIRDTDGDGAGDKVFFVFTRPLAALPAAIDAIYWNDFGLPAAGVPVLSFLPGSGNTVVIADLTLHPFPVGLTGIPPGGKPIAILPDDHSIFAAQRPPIADSIGPILDSAVIKPFDNSKVQPGGDLNMDTLVVYASEPMRTENTWNNMLLWSKTVAGKCDDYAHALHLVPSGQPGQDANSRVFTFIVPTGTGVPTPLAGDCVYIDTNGVYSDLNKNLPPENGTLIKGKKPPEEIELFRGYPPVVGLTADHPGFVVVTNDPRKTDTSDYSTKDLQSGRFVTEWVPPYGFVIGQPFEPVIPDIRTPSTGIDPNEKTPMPNNVASVQVVSTGKYIVDISIYDNNGVFVRKLRQAFGFHGELNNRDRISNRGMVSYLVWDLRDFKGQKAGQGVYIWKALFHFETGKQDIEYTKTGVVRNLRP